MKADHVFTAGNVLCRWLVAAALGCLSLSAHAFVPWNHTTDFVPTAGSGTWVPGPGATNTYGTGRTTPTAGGPLWSSASKDLPFKPATTAKFGATFSPASMAKAFAKPAFAFGAGMAASMAFQAAMHQACVRLAGGQMQLAANGLWEECNMVPQEMWATVSQGTEDMSKAGACNKQATIMGLAMGGGFAEMSGKVNTTTDRCELFYWNGQSAVFFNSYTFSRVTGHVQDGWKPATATRAEEQLKATFDKWAAADNQYGYDPAARPATAPAKTMKDVLDEAMAGGLSVDATLTPPVVQTPVMEPPVQTTVTDPATGKATASTEQTKNDYSCLVIQDGKAVECSQKKTTTTVTATTSTNPDGTTSTSTITKTEQKTGEKEEGDPCDSHPDRAGCATLDTPTGEVPKRTEALTYQPEELGFGSGVCPAPITSTVRGQTIKVFDYAPGCNLLTTYVKPLVLALSAFIAMMILIPGGRTE